MCSHDIFQSCDQKRAYKHFQGKKTNLGYLRSAFAFTYSRKLSQFGFASFTGFTSLLASDHQGKKSHCADPGNS